jgi:hypothetical protein
MHYWVYSVSHSLTKFFLVEQPIISVDPECINQKSPSNEELFWYKSHYFGLVMIRTIAV